MSAHTRRAPVAFAAALIAAPCLAHPPALSTLRLDGNRAAAHALIPLGGAPSRARTGVTVANAPIRNAPVKTALRPTLGSRGAGMAANALIRTVPRPTVLASRPMVAVADGSIKRRPRSK